MGGTSEEGGGPKYIEYHRPQRSHKTVLMAVAL